MKKFSVLALLLALGSVVLCAQNKTVSVSGCVIEADTKAPAAQATIQLLALPDSVYTTGAASDDKGVFTLPRAKVGRYVLKVSYIGCRTKLLPLTLTSKEAHVNLANIFLEPDAVMLKEAVVTGQVPEVVVREDTIEFNSAAYRTPEGAMLEELVKKLPGAEIDENGNVKINGKEVKKIMLEGKEFFGGDVKTGLKNLPVHMIEKLKTYDKKSDLARVTGIDDGEEETVIDLKVKKGMKEGWFGNADVAAGSEKRYSGHLMLNRFDDHNQFTVIGSANNVNDKGFSGGGGRPRFRGNNGLTATKMTGVNFATETDKLELGGSVRYNYSDQDASSLNYSERFLQNGNSYSNSNNKNRDKQQNLHTRFRLEWKPDTMTNVIFRPSLSYSKNRRLGASESGTFDRDPFELVSNPNEFLNLGALDENGGEDPLHDIRVNASNTHSLSKGNSLSADAMLQLNRRLNAKGRNVTLRGGFGYTDKDNDQFSQSLTHYYQLKSLMPGQLEADSILHRDQYITTPTKNYQYTAQVTYSEPIAKATFLQFNYRFQYKYSESDKRTYDLYDMGWEFGTPLPDGYASHLVDSLGKRAEYHYYNHDIQTSLRLIREKYQLNVGVSLQPQRSSLSYKKGSYMTDTVRTVFNFSPTISFRYRFSKVSQLRFNYRGRSSQPSMENLLPITDNSNPLNIRTGNPGLKPSFSHNIFGFYNNYQAEIQQSMRVHFWMNFQQNGIANVTRYNYENGGLITRPENINGNWSGSFNFGYNRSLKDKRFKIDTSTDANYTNSVSYLYNQQSKGNDKNTSTSMVLGEHLRGTFSNDWLELTLNGSIRYNWERNKLRPENNQEPFTYGFGASTTINLPWSMSLATNVTNNVRRGYRDASMNRNEVIWNAQIAQSFLKNKAASIRIEFYDILKQQSNISRSLTADLRSVSEYNGINSYFMVHFSYKLNLFGNKEARKGMKGMRGPGFGGPHGGFHRGMPMIHHY